MRQIEQAAKLLGITRIAAKPLAHRINADLAVALGDKEMWFGPDGGVIGLYTPAEGLAALRRCVGIVDRERSTKH